MRKQTKIAALVSAAALLTIGASMTSFAKWDVEDGQWVYLDGDGEKVEYEWKKSGADWYYLGEGGYMVTDQLIEDDNNGDIYYVGTDGRRVINDWRAVPNDEGEEINDIVVDTLWYYFGATGKAYRDTDSNLDGNYIKKTVSWSGGSNIFFFDANGHMVNGWIWYHDNDGKWNRYFLGDETEGWARAKGVNGSNGWYYLELPDSLRNTSGPSRAYEDEEWFYFQTSGKAYRAYEQDGKPTVSKYIDNLYYTFDDEGVLQDKWFEASTAAGVSSAPYAFTGLNGNKAGWVYAPTKADEDTSKWFYLVNVSNGKMVAFGTSNNKNDLFARNINGKTYIFNGNGEMQSGIVKIAADRTEDEDAKVCKSSWNGSPNGVVTLKPGTYLFSKAAASQGDDGRMLTGKQSYTDEDQTSTYYFRKTDEGTTYSKGSAITNEIKDNALYGPDGKRVEAEDGNSYDLVDVEGLRTVDGVASLPGIKVDDLNYKYTKGTFVVSSSGKIKKNGNITIDGTVYRVSNYVVIEAYEKGDRTHPVTSTWVTAAH